VVSVGDEITTYKTMHQSKHGVLDGANRVEMPTMTYGVLWGVNCMWEIWAHNPENTQNSA
jgi:hypothetical protein